MAQYYIGVDLGGTKIGTVLTDANGQVCRSDFRPTPVQFGQAAVLAEILKSIETVCEGSKTSAVALGIATPGPINRSSGKVIFAPNLNWHEVPIIELLQERLQIPCFLENDANAAAFGEKVFGQGRSVTDLIYITVSTGIGSGLIINGEIFHGRDDSAGELGHIILDINGPQCGCGHYGCLEALASGTAIARDAVKALSEGEPSLLRILSKGTAELITAKLVAEAAAQGDPLANRILKQAYFYVGIGIANMIQLLNPELVIIGGGVAQIGEPFFSEVKRIIHDHTWSNFSNNLSIVPTSLGRELGALGAAAVAIKNIPPNNVLG